MKARSGSGVTGHSPIDVAIRDRLPADCDLRVDVPLDLPALRADADALTTALVNLLENALKYTRADKRIVVGAEGGEVIVTVEDNGIGIPARERRRIFERFYRVDARLTRDTGGLGLGLSIVELIGRAHGGTITLHSRVGGGSTFALHLPLATGEPV